MLIFLPRLTLLVKTGEKKHYYVVLTNPAGLTDNESYVVWVSWRSVKKGQYYDDACVLDDGDHPKIDRRTWVDYSFAEIKPVSEIKRGIANGAIAQCEPVSEEVYKRIVAGIRTTRYIDDDVLKFCEQRL